MVRVEVETIRIDKKKRIGMKKCSNNGVEDHSEDRKYMWLCIVKLDSRQKGLGKWLGK